MENPQRQQGEREVTKRKSKESIYQVTYSIAYLVKTPPITLVKLKGMSLTLSARSPSACKVKRFTKDVTAKDFNSQVNRGNTL